MKRYFLHQWLMAALAILFLANCSKKNYSHKSSDEEISYTKNEEPENYSPAHVITISDEFAKTNRQGEMYYDNEYGYRYWRFCDGKYYLDEKYETDNTKPKASKKKNKKYNKKKIKEQAEDDENT
jgi:hypothetical protein